MPRACTGSRDTGGEFIKPDSCVRVGQDTSARAGHARPSATSITFGEGCPVGSAFSVLLPGCRRSRLRPAALDGALSITTREIRGAAALQGHSTPQTAPWRPAL